MFSLAEEAQVKVCISLFFAAPTTIILDSVWTKTFLGCLVWLYMLQISPSPVGDRSATSLFPHIAQFQIHVPQGAVLQCKKVHWDVVGIDD